MDKLGDAERLKRLYEERVPKGMSQADFGQTYGIGTQGMVSQYLNGHQPLTVEAAAKFAKGLRCTIADISPEMTRRLRVEIIPVLGRVSLKAALAFILVIPPFLQTNAEAAFSITLSTMHIVLRRWLQRVSRLYRRRQSASALPDSQALTESRRNPIAQGR